MDKRDIILAKFNEKFLELITTYRKYVPNLKDIILVEDALDFFINRGNREIPLCIFKIAVYKYKDEIFNNDDTIFEENKIMTEIMDCAKKMGENGQNVEEITSNENSSKILNNIRLAKNAWKNMQENKKENIWKMLQTLVILSEKIKIGS